MFGDLRVLTSATQRYIHGCGQLLSRFCHRTRKHPTSHSVTKACANLGGGCIAHSDSARGGALVVRGTLKSESTSLLYIRVRGRYGVGSEGHEVESWARVGNGLLKRQHQMAHF